MMWPAVKKPCGRVEGMWGGLLFCCSALYWSHSISACGATNQSPPSTSTIQINRWLAFYLNGASLRHCIAFLPLDVWNNLVCIIFCVMYTHTHTHSIFNYIMPMMLKMVSGKNVQCYVIKHYLSYLFFVSVQHVCRRLLAVFDLPSWGRCELVLSMLQDPTATYTLEDVVQAVRESPDRDFIRRVLNKECPICLSVFPQSKVLCVSSFSVICSKSCTFYIRMPLPLGSWTVYPKIKSFIHHYFVPNLYEFLSSVEHTRKYFKDFFLLHWLL